MIKQKSMTTPNDRRNTNRKKSNAGKLCRFLIFIALTAVCVLGATGLACAATSVTYYVTADHGTNVGADGYTNLYNGNSNDNAPVRSLFSKTSPSGLTTEISGNYYWRRIWYSMATIYLSDNYSSDTVIGANPSARMVVSSSSSRDQFMFILEDYDPNGSSGNGSSNVIAVATAGSSNSKISLNINFSGSDYTIPAGHRLVLEILYYPNSYNSTGSVYCNSNSNNSYINVSEGAPSVYYSIAATAGTGGAISPSGTISVIENGSQTFTFTPNSGYYISDVRVDGISQGTLNSYTFSNVNSNHTISVYFIQKFTITPSAGTGGSITPSSPVLIDSGGSQTFSITPNSGYQIQNVQVNGVSVGAVNSYTISNLNQDTTIVATFLPVTSKISQYTVTPPYLATLVPPNVMIMLSVESPMQGAAYPDLTCTGNPASTTYGCSSNASNVSGRYVSNNYNNATIYTGYFDPNKCYAYSGSGTSGMFVPSSAATNHTCGGTAWSGNFLNYATTMAIDSFRLAFTGGNRDTDVGGISPSTVLIAGRQTLSAGHSWFPIKRIDNAQSYIPFSGTNYIVRHANGFSVCSTPGCSVAESGTGMQRFPTTSGTSGVVGAYNIRIKVCDPSAGLESYCNADNDKPEGILQQYQNQMRFGLISYAMLNNTDASRDGGVIRSNMKWIQPTIPYNIKYNDSTGAVVTCNSTAGCSNPEAELNTDGTFINNPDGASSGNSGIINYINKFGYTSGYKNDDPVSEMYYQVIRYFMKKGPSTDNYCNGIGTSDDGFKAYCSSGDWSKSNPNGWRDPYIYPCSQGAVVGIQDANPWLDKRIPGSAFTAQYGGSYSDYCSSSHPCDSDMPTGFDARVWTNKVGDAEGLTPGWLNVGCVFDGSTPCTSIDSSTPKYVTELGRVVGTAPWAGKENSYYIAGLSYYAHMNNLRPDLSGNHTLTSYFIDTQEPNYPMLVGKMNMLYLAAKYGGFTDTDGDGKPFTNNTCGSGSSSNPKCAEWDSTGTGFPDTYMFASNPAQVSVGLNKAFSDILRRLASGTAASILNNSQGSGANLLQAVFYPQKTFDSNTQASWVGELQNLWYYIDPYFNLSTVREDTVSDDKLHLIDDYVVNFYFDSTQNKTLVSRLKDTDGKGDYSSIDTVTPDNVNSLWKAGKILQNTSPSSRTIKTVLGGSMIDFTTAYANNTTLQTELQATSTSDAASIIDYIRGTDYPRSGYPSDPVFRGRTVSYQGTTGVWKLGDIISSTPKIESTVSLNTYELPTPNGYNDTSYRSYVNSYDYGTRGTAFVGSNDGMLHAFKLGILDVRLSDLSFTSKARLIGSNLGSEQWAFIPQNALPYLRYLTDPAYAHIYYVDGTPLVVDASINNVAGSGNYWDSPKQTTYLQDSNHKTIFGDTGIPNDPKKSPSDSTLKHPDDFIQLAKLDKDKTSWRTILIGGMGLGGASRDSSDSCEAGTFTSACVKTPVSGLGYSSYFALDVTNPESPTFKWEFAGDPANGHYLGYSTSGPAIIRVGSKNSNGRWFAVFASGPTGPIDTGSKQFIGTSSQNLLIFVVDLATGSLVTTIDTGISDAFAGTISSSVIDVDRGNASSTGNYQDDAIYIGYTQKDSTTGTWTKGGVLRLLTNENPDPSTWYEADKNPSILIDNTGPVTTSITKLQDRQNHNLWIYFGTGRYFYKSSTQPDDPGPQDAIYGIKEPCYSTLTGPTNRLDSNCNTTINGSMNSSSLFNQTGSASTSPQTTMPSGKNGWVIDLDCIGTSCYGTPLNDGFMSERVITDPVASTNGTVYFTTFRPTTDVCGFGGNSYIWAVKYNTGGVPFENTMQGMALVQVSTGAFAEISMSSAFGGQSNKGYNNRRLASPIQGVPPKSQGLSLLTNPKPVKKILQIQER